MEWFESCVANRRYSVVTKHSLTTVFILGVFKMPWCLVHELTQTAFKTYYFLDKFRK